MKFVIITHVPHLMEQNQFCAYAPYVREMNIWGKYVDELIIVAPKTDRAKTAIDCPYEHQNVEFVTIDGFDVLGIRSALTAVCKIPKISWRIYKAMKKADHIHLRCPGNIGLLGCVVQIALPRKAKTAKYAGNWDPKSKQPWSYKLQKWILSNTFLTRNMRVLVYGEWPEQSKNIIPFFTATYKEDEKLGLVQKELNSNIQFIFVGTLTKEKNPLYAIQIVEQLYKKGYDVSLCLYGEGIERVTLEQYVIYHHLEDVIFLKGNRSQAVVKEAYQLSHFVILASESEGWPKAIAEGMFWGCVPLATAVSCVPFMLDYGNRGVLLEMKLEKDVAKIKSLLRNQSDFNNKREEGATWSRSYTMDVFEQEVKYLLKGNTKIID